MHSWLTGTPVNIPWSRCLCWQSCLWALRVWRLGNIYIAGTLFALSLASFAAGLALGVKVFQITTWVINIEFSFEECPYLYYSQPVGYGKDQKPNDCMADLASRCRYLNIRYMFWRYLPLDHTEEDSVTLIIYLVRSRTGFQRSNSVINRLIRTSVQTGTRLSRYQECDRYWFSYWF